MHTRHLTCLAALAICACSSGIIQPDASEFSYKITEEGGPQISDRHEFRALGEKSLRKTQRYRLSAQSDNGRQFHFLSARVQKRVGDQVIATDDAIMVPIIDGTYTYECEHYYTVELSTPDERVENPACSIEPIAVFLPSAPAVRFQSSN